jgi:hypothetical protein
MNVMRKARVLVFLSGCALFAFCGCQSVTPSLDTSKADALISTVQTKQATIQGDAATAAASVDALVDTISTIKPGEVVKAETVTKLVKQGDDSQNIIHRLYSETTTQTKTIGDMAIAKINENKAANEKITALTVEIDTIKPWRGRFWIAIAVIGLIAAALVVSFKLKIIKF